MKRRFGRMHQNEVRCRWQLGELKLTALVGCDAQCADRLELHHDVPTLAGAPLQRLSGLFKSDGETWDIERLEVQLLGRIGAIASAGVAKQAAEERIASLLPAQKAIKRLRGANCADYSGFSEAESQKRESPGRVIGCESWRSGLRRSRCHHNRPKSQRVTNDIDAAMIAGTVGFLFATSLQQFNLPCIEIVVRCDHLYFPRLHARRDDRTGAL